MHLLPTPIIYVRLTLADITLRQEKGCVELTSAAGGRGEGCTWWEREMRRERERERERERGEREREKGGEGERGEGEKWERDEERERERGGERE